MHQRAYAAGTVLRVGLKLLGQAAAAMPAAIGALAGVTIPCGGGSFRLARARDAGAGGRVIYDASYQHFPVQPVAVLRLGEICGVESSDASAVRVVLLTPVFINRGDGCCRDPFTLAATLLEQSLVRAIKVHDSLCTPGAVRLPRMEMSVTDWHLVGQRLFHYRFLRHSNRQERWMEFGGLVGWLDLAGDIGSLLPLLRAAEVLHLGQKATFGMGQVRIFAGSEAAKV